MISKNSSYAVTENGLVVFTGNKNDCHHIRKTLQKQNPARKIKVWFSLNKHIGDTIKIFA